MAKRGRPPNFKPGLYQFKTDYVDEYPYIYFTGKYWVQLGDDHHYTISDKSTHSSIVRSQIGKFLGGKDGSK